MIVVAGASLMLASPASVAGTATCPLAVAAAATATLLGAPVLGLLGRGRLEPVQQMARLVTSVRQHGEPSGTYHAFVRNLVFYTGVKQNDLVDEREAVEFLTGPERVLCVMPLDLLEALERSTRLQLRRLATVLYFNPAGVRLRTLLSPEPERDLETVVLVTNGERRPGFSPAPRSARRSPGPAFTPGRSSRIQDAERDRTRA